MKTTLKVLGLVAIISLSSCGEDEILQQNFNEPIQTSNPIQVDDVEEDGPN